MSDGEEIDPSLREVWIRFTDHFLDTDTRHDLPFSALTALEAGYGAEEAEQIWCDEVEPAVGINLLAPVGEWAGFDEAWLIERLQRMRRIGHGTAPPRRGALFEPAWRALRGCMEALAAVDPANRRSLARDLKDLAQHYFDFVPRPFDLSAPGRADALEQLFREVFLPIFEPLVARAHGETPRSCRWSVELALGRGPRLVGWWRRWKAARRKEGVGR